MRKRRLKKIEKRLKTLQTRLAYSEQSFHHRSHFTQMRDLVLNSFDKSFRDVVFNKINDNCSAFLELLSPGFKASLLQMPSLSAAGLDSFESLYAGSVRRFASRCRLNDACLEDLGAVMASCIQLVGQCPRLFDLKTALENSHRKFLEHKQLDSVQQLTVRKSSRSSSSPEQPRKPAKAADLDLKALVRVCCQFFFVFVVPGPFFLQLEQQRPRVSKLALLRRLSDRRDLFLEELGAAFPRLKASLFLESLFFKLEHFCNFRFESLEILGPKSRTRGGAKGVSANPSKYRNYKKEFVIESVESHPRETRPCEETFFVNGFLSSSDDNALYFHESFHFFNRSQIRVVNWNSEALGHVVVKGVSVTAVGALLLGVVLVPLAEIEIFLMPFCGFAGSVIPSLLATSFSSYKRAEKNAIQQGEKLFLKISYRNQHRPSLMNYFCFSLGTLFIFTFLRNIIERDSPLLVKNVVMLGGVLCQTQIARFVDRLLGPEGIVRGRLVLVSCRRDSVLKYVIKHVFRQSPVGYDAFDYVTASNRLMEQNAKFQRLGFEETKAYLENKVKQVDVTSMVNGHLDYKTKYGSISSLVHQYLI